MTETIHVDLGARSYDVHVGAGLIAWPVAAINGKPELILLIPAIGACAAVDGFASTSVLTLRRQLARGRGKPQRRLQEEIDRLLS